MSHPPGPGISGPEPIEHIQLPGWGDERVEGAERDRKNDEDAKEPLHPPEMGAVGLSGKRFNGADPIAAWPP